MNNDNASAPYPGPRPFEVGMQKIFYGRDQELSELLSQIISHRVVLLHAQSGAGKTSLLQAGLMPRLVQEGFEVLPIVRVGGHIPKNIDTLKIDNVFILNTLLTWSKGKVNPQSLVSLTIADFLKERKHLTDEDNFPKPRIVIFDQFEQLFTWYTEYWSKREGFFTDVANALNEDDLLRVLFVLREDFIANLDPYAEIMPGRFKTKYRLERLSPEAAHKAIEDPLLGRNLSFDKGIADELIKELQKIQITTQTNETSTVPGDHIEPVQLQVVCKKLWDNLHDKVNLITHNHLTTIGDVDTALGDYYEDALTDTVQKTGIKENKVRHWFETELITAEGTRGTVFQGKTHTGTLPNEAVKIFENQHYLVRAEMRAGAHWYELTHDRFVKPIQIANQKFRRAQRKRHRKRNITIAVALFALLPILTIFLNNRIEDRLFAKQIKVLRNLQQNDRLKFSKADTVFRNAVYYYFWTKKDRGSFDKLISLLENNKNLIPKNYGIAFNAGDTVAYGNILTDWPLVLEYNPGSQIDLKQLQLEWYNMVSSIASVWGIPAPMRIKFSSNPNLSPNDFHILTQAYKPYDSDTIYKITERTIERLNLNQDMPDSVKKILKKFKENNLNFSKKEDVISKLEAKLPKNNLEEQTSNEVCLSQANKDTILANIELFLVVNVDLLVDSVHYLVSTKNITDDRLLKFFKENSKIYSGPQLKRGGPWYSVPHWTLPLLKAAGLDFVSDEGADAFLIKNKILEKPQFLLTPECVAFLINREKENSPITVNEALLNRGGIDGIRRDLTDLVRFGTPLTALQYNLGALSKYTIPSSAELARLVNYDLEHIKESQDIRLQGKRLQKVQYQNRETNAQTRFAYVYEEAGNLLPAIEPPVRIYLGSRTVKQVILPDGKVSPQMIESIAEVQGNIYKKFGINVPGVKFRVDEVGICDSCFRIEVLNKNSENEGAKSVAVSPDSAIVQITRNLQVISSALRTWWITPEYINSLLEGKFADWLKEQYTLTDLKLILRAVILPSDEKVNLYSKYLDEKAMATIPPENTLLDLKWLLGSLVYWLNSGLDRLNLQVISDKLRQTQLSRINISEINPSSDKITMLIQQGIGALAKGQYNTAASNFKKAVTMDQQQATKIFLALYAHSYRFASKYQLAQFIKTLTLPTPGEVINTNALESQDLYDLEIILSSAAKAGSEDQIRNLNLCLLDSYIKNQYYEKAYALIDQLLKDHSNQVWSANEEYLLAYYILSDRESATNKPTLKNEADSLLRRTFVKWKVDQAEKPFYELVKLFEKEYSDIRSYWISLDSLASLQPKSIWIPLNLSTQFCLVSDNYDEAHRGIKLLDRAESNISQIIKQDQARIMAWIDWYRSNAYLKIARYRKADRDSAIENALRLLTKLKSLIHPEEYWPSFEDVYSNLVSVYMTSNEQELAMQAVDEGLSKFPGSLDLLELKFFLELASGQIPNAMEVAEQAFKPDFTEDQAPSLYMLSVAQFLTDSSEFEYTARNFLQTNHEYLDYIRMMLYTAHLKQGNTDEAKKLLEKRWEQIDSSTWQERLQNGDTKVWREKLIGYYMGIVDRESIFGPLSNPKTFETHPFSKLDMPLSGLICEGYFYDALLQGVKGKVKTRYKRQVELLEKVLETKHYDYYEYHMASYLLGKLKKKQASKQVVKK